MGGFSFVERLSASKRSLVTGQSEDDECTSYRVENSRAGGDGWAAVFFFGPGFVVVRVSFRLVDRI